MSADFEYISHFWIPMPDGERLGARAWLPVDARNKPVPAILEYIPYRKDDCTVARDSTTHPQLVACGYACLRVDMRGSGSSDGVKTDEYSEQEMQDGEDVIRWIAERDWCDGKVGMIGISWGGITGLQMASRRAEYLQAVVALGASEFRYYDDGSYYLGCMVGQTIGWAAIMFGFNARPPDPLHCGDGWRDLWRRRLEETPLYLGTWLAHQREDDYWLRGTVGTDYAAIEIPVYAVSGHADCWPNTVPRLLENLTCPRQGLQGPWAHRYPQMAIPGPAIDFMPEVVRWFDRWLKGAKNGIEREPMYRVYMQDSVRPQSYYAQRPGRWIAELKWPSDRVSLRSYHFGDHRLLDQPGNALELRLCSPQTVGLAGGEYMPWFNFGPAAELPQDQRDEDADSLVFDSAPLGETIEILGNASVLIEISCDKPQALIAARICDLWPDGASTLITRGLLNLSQRDGKSMPQKLIPGHRYLVEVKLNHVAYAVPAGHRLRLALSSSYWPIAWPSPERATLSIYTAFSHLLLPVLSKNADDLPLEPFGEPRPLHSAGVDHLRPHEEKRGVRIDDASGESVLEINTDNGRQRLSETGLEMDSDSLQRYSIHPADPLSATAHYRWRWQFQRADWQVTTETSITMTSTETTFDVVAELVARENDTEVFRRHWRESYPRDHF